MFTFQGRIVLSETGIGIPDLNVVFYDYDPGQKNEDQGVAEGKTVFSFVSKFQGDRLGSVLTDADGNFLLNFSEKDFTIQESEKRPDLFFFILGPQKSERGNVFAENEAKRIIHLSSAPIANIGRQESLIIKIETKTLEKFNIPIPRESSTSGSPKNVEALFQTSLSVVSETDANIKKVKSEFVKDRFEKRKQIDEKASKLVKNLSAKRKGRNTSESFLLKADSDFKQTQIDSITVSGNRLNSYNKKSNSILTFGKEELLKSFDPTIANRLISSLDSANSGDTITEQVPLKSLCGFIQASSNGPTIEKKGTIEQLFEKKKDAEGKIERLKNPASDTAGEPASNGGCDSPGMREEDLENEFRRLAIEKAREYGDLKEIETASPEGQFRKLTELSEEISKGPADNTAFHDFYSLQLAYPEIWEEAFDKKFEDRVKSLFREHLMLKEDFGISDSLPNEALGDIEQLQEFLEFVSEDSQRVMLDIDEDVRQVMPNLEISTWNSLSDNQQKEAIKLAKSILHKRRLIDANAGNPNNSPLFQYDSSSESLVPNITAENTLQVLTFTAIQTIEGEREKLIEIISNPKGRIGKIMSTILEIGERLNEPYAFDVFAPNSVNFGIVTTFRQKWKPENYQVGKLVSTIPLAPGETRKYSKKLSLKRQRSQKELQKSMFETSDESSYTSRAEAEITSKASKTTDFQTTASGSFNFGIGSTNFSTSFSQNQSQESSKSKKSFREAVVKASQKFKNEREIEVSSSSESQFDSTTSGEIKNPNNEITVTYLFYELERQFRISEHIHRVTPVVLVAQEVPSPHEVDEDWILSYEWILRRVILDDSFNEALDYIGDGLISDELNLKLKRERIKDLKEQATELKDELLLVTDREDELEDKLNDLQEARANAKTKRGPIKRKRKLKKYKALIEDNEEDIEMIAEEIAEISKKLNQTNSSLEKAIEDYSSLTSRFQTKRMRVNQLRIHIKQNILYYMQAIWDHEPPDQRYFRLHNTMVSFPSPEGWDRATGEESQVTIRLVPKPKGPFDELLPTKPYKVEFIYPDFHSVTEPTLDSRPLHSIADINNPLGYKGNYMMFPLKECIYITDFMTQEFIGDYLGVRDPDLESDVSTEELLRMAAEVWNATSTSQEQKDSIEAEIQRRLTSPKKENELIVVPTGQLYIEALPGSKPLLENFKLKHREMDMEKVRHEVLEQMLDNVRRAKKIREGELEDPEVEKVINVNGHIGSIGLPTE